MALILVGTVLAGAAFLGLAVYVAANMNSGIWQGAAPTVASAAATAPAGQVAAVTGGSAADQVAGTVRSAGAGVATRDGDSAGKASGASAKGGAEAGTPGSGATGSAATGGAANGQAGTASGLQAAAKASGFSRTMTKAQLTNQVVGLKIAAIRATAAGVVQAPPSPGPLGFDVVVKGGGTGVGGPAGQVLRRASARGSVQAWAAAELSDDARAALAKAVAAHPNDLCVAVARVCGDPSYSVDVVDVTMQNDGFVRVGVDITRNGGFYPQVVTEKYEIIRIVGAQGVPAEHVVYTWTQ